MRRRSPRSHRFCCHSAQDPEAAPRPKAATPKTPSPQSKTLARQLEPHSVQGPKCVVVMLSFVLSRTHQDSPGSRSPLRQRSGATNSPRQAALLFSRDGLPRFHPSGCASAHRCAPFQFPDALANSKGRVRGNGSPTKASVPRYHSMERATSATRKTGTASLIAIDFRDAA